MSKSVRDDALNNTIVVGVAWVSIEDHSFKTIHSRPDL